MNDILELSKIESRRAPLLFSPVELGPFIAKTVELLAKEAERKNIRIETEVGDELYVEADEDRLRQIVVNVLSNAINYTPEGRPRSSDPASNRWAHPETGRSRRKHDYDAIRIRIDPTTASASRRRICRASSSGSTGWTRRAPAVRAAPGSACPS